MWITREIASVEYSYEDGKFLVCTVYVLAPFPGQTFAYETEGFIGVLADG